MSIPTTNEQYINAQSTEADRGILNSVCYDPTNFFHFNRAPNEIVVSNQQTNSWIVLGRDRLGNWKSGYGGMGHLKAGAIDIVVGRLSSLDASQYGPVNPSVGADAARVYLSQKTNVDENFSIPGGSTGKSQAQSAVAIKADAVRIVGRDSVKLVTRTDEILANGVQSYRLPGIQLITKTGPEEPKMEPIPKGYALSAALEQLKNLING